MKKIKMSEKKSSFRKDTMSFLKEKRVLLGYTQADVAEVIYGDKRYRSTICALENGNHPLSMKVLEKYLELFNCEFNGFKEN